MFRKNKEGLSTGAKILPQYRNAPVGTAQLESSIKELKNELIITVEDLFLKKSQRNKRKCMKEKE